MTKNLKHLKFTCHHSSNIPNQSRFKHDRNHVNQIKTLVSFIKRKLLWKLKFEKRTRSTFDSHTRDIEQQFQFA